jgi:hypothetical protein
MWNRSIFLSLAVALVITGCGLVSGTVFVSQEVDNRIESNVGSTLDDQFTGAVVNFKDNSDFKKVTIEGVEDVCIRVTAANLLSTPISGEIWVTADTIMTGQTPATVRASGFRVFHGIALNGNQTRTFTCAETLQLLENLDRLSAVVETGYFAVWAMGDQNTYHVTFDGIVFGVHVTGSL